MDQVLIPSSQPEPKQKDFFDPNLPTPQTDRPRRAFHFLEAGSIVKKSEKIRAKLRGDIVVDDSVVKKEEPIVKLEELMTIVREEKFQVGLAKRLSKEPIPDVEWWDKFLIPGNVYDMEKIQMEEIGAYIEHPVAIQPPSAKPNEQITFNMYYTKKEQRKLRRHTRLEKERDKHEQQIFWVSYLQKNLK